MTASMDMELLQHAAFAADRAARIAGVSAKQLREWDDKGLLVSRGAWPREAGEARFYSFRDLVELRVISRLRNEHGVPLQQLRKLRGWMDAAGSSWATLKFYVQQRRLHFDDPQTGRQLTTMPFGQAVMPFDIAPIVEDTKARLMRERERRPDQIGRITRNRAVHANQPVIDGTRLLVSTVVGLRASGLKLREIADRFPGVELDDIRAALRYAKEHAA